MHHDRSSWRAREVVWLNALNLQLFPDGTEIVVRSSPRSLCRHQTESWAEIRDGARKALSRHTDAIFWRQRAKRHRSATEVIGDLVTSCDR
jgi:hypothetical protein